MASSDWVTIITTFISLIIAVAVSWVFFRAQQSTDFNKLRDAINSLENILNQYRAESSQRQKEISQFLKIDFDKLQGVISNLGDNVNVHRAESRQREEEISQIVRTDFNKLQDAIEEQIAQQIAQQIPLIIGQNSQSAVRTVVIEMVDHLAEISRQLSFSSPNLTGTWNGRVEGSKEIVEIEQRDKVVDLKGTVFDAFGKEKYEWSGNGRATWNTLIFFWKIKNKNVFGTNIMTISPKGDILQGKFINHNAEKIGDETYERADNR